MDKEQQKNAGSVSSATGTGILHSSAVPDLIYCASGNKRFAQIAIDAGFLYGAQLPGTIYHPIYFADQNWKNPDRGKYMAALAEHRPYMASVLDLENGNQLPEVLDWAEEAAQWVNIVMIIPKVFGIISKLPRCIGSADVRLGYSIPTKHGGTEVPIWEFYNWPIHLLGGSPHKQMEIRKYLDVKSADGNYHGLKARKWGEYWERPGRWVPGQFQYKDGIYDAFELSCKNIIEAWQK